MKIAYAGQPDNYEYQVQNVYQAIAKEAPKTSIWESLTYELGDRSGYGWIIGLAAFGAVWFFKKRIKGFIKNFIEKE